MIPDTNAVAGKMLCLNLRAIIAAPIVLLIISCGYEWTHQDCVNCEYEWTYRDCERWKNASVSDIRSELERGADVNAMLGSHYGYWFTESTPLHLAVKCSSNPDIADLLLSHGADVNATDSYFKNTPLYEATRNPEGANAEAIELLLEHGADANAKAYVHECGHGHPLDCELVRTTILYSAVDYHVDPTVVELLLEHDAEVNARDYADWTALLRVAVPFGPAGAGARQDYMPNTIDVVRLLLEYGADINARNQDGRTALHLMAPEASTPLIQVMLDHGADVNAQIEFGETPLHKAASNPNPDVTRLLLANGAAVNAIDFHRYTPLHRSMSPDEHHWSIKRGDSYPPSIEVIAELLRSGADPNARNRWNSTALHAAVINRNSPRQNDIIELLLDYGADPGAVDNAGRTPCRYTRDANVSEQITKRLCR